MKKATEKRENIHFTPITQQLLNTIGVLTCRQVTFDRALGVNRVSIDGKSYSLDLIALILGEPSSLAEILPEYLDPGIQNRGKVTSPLVSKAKMQTSLLDIELLHSCFRSLPLRRRLVRIMKASLIQNKVRVKRFIDGHPRVFAILNTRTVKAIYRRLTGN